MTKVKVTLGWLKRSLPIAIEYHRLNMDYTYEVEEKKLGWFKKERTEKPLNDVGRYWAFMQTFYPWNQVANIDYLIQNGKALATLEVDAVLISKIMEALARKSDKELSNEG